MFEKPPHFHKYQCRIAEDMVQKDKMAKFQDKFYKYGAVKSILYKQDKETDLITVPHGDDKSLPTLLGLN